jgi:hypothetical protein
MARATAKRRLFVGCRNPQKMVVMDTSDGKVLASLPIGMGVDDPKMDRGQAFASCRDGTRTVVGETSRGNFEIVQTLKTRAGAQASQEWPAAKPDTFMILIAERR